MASLKVCFVYKCAYLSVFLCWYLFDCLGGYLSGCHTNKDFCTVCAYLDLNMVCEKCRGSGRGILNIALKLMTIFKDSQTSWTWNKALLGLHWQWEQFWLWAISTGTWNKLLHISQEWTELIQIIHFIDI